MAAGVSEYIERVETDGGEVESDIYVSESVEDLGDFFDDASLVNIPTAYKATKLYSIKPTDGSGDFTFARSTTATRVNESGLIESVGVNVPRIDYSSGTPALLLEPQRTNLMTNSEDASGFYGGATITNDFTQINPAGLYSSVKMSNLQAVTGDRVGFLTSNITAGNTYTASVYIKGTAGETTNYQFKRIGGTYAGTPVTPITFDGTWQKIEATFTTLPDNTGVTFQIVNTTSVTADVIYLWGGQIEEGSYATSYIPTSGTAVTRTIDAITNNVSYALSTGYTIFIELQTQSLTVSNDIEFKDASSNYVFRVGDEVIVGAGLFTQANTTGFNKFALQVDAAGNYELFKNGSSVTSGSGIAHDIEVISSVAGQDVRQMIVFEQALTDAECITLTT